jgi:hypothetical protein
MHSLGRGGEEEEESHSYLQMRGTAHLYRHSVTMSSQVVDSSDPEAELRRSQIRQFITNGFRELNEIESQLVVNEDLLESSSIDIRRRGRYRPYQEAVSLSHRYELASLRRQCNAVRTNLFVLTRSS